MKSYILFLLSICSCTVFAQKFWTDSDAIQKESFEKMVSETESFYNSQSDQEWKPGYKPFMRWQIRQRQRMGLKGEMVNGELSTYQAMKKWKKKSESQKETQRSFHGVWQEEGPYENENPYLASLTPGMGRINCIAFHPNNVNTIFVGAAAGGLWKSTNDGNTWQPMTDGLTSIGISGITINPLNADEMWILTGDGDGAQTFSIGILYSNDGGSTWTRRGPSYDIDQLVRSFKLLAHPVQGQIQYAATSAGLYKTLNGWQTWSKVLNEYTWDVELHPNDQNRIYAATSDGLFISINGGFDWNQEDGNGLLPANGYSRFAIGVTPDRPNDVVLLYGGGVSGFPGLFRSTNSGQNWNLQYDNNGFNLFSRSLPFMDSVHQAGYDLALALHPDSAEVIYTGGINIFKSQNFGSSFNAKSYWTNQTALPYVHADIHALEFNSNGHLYVACDGGLFKSTNGGNSYQDLSEGLRIAQYYFLDIANDRVVAGAQDNGTSTLDLNVNNNGDNVLGGDGMGCFFRGNSENDYFISTQSLRYHYDPHPAFASDFVDITSSLNLGDHWDEDFISLPGSNGILHCRNEVYRSFNSGSSWEDMDAFDNNETDDVSAIIASDGNLAGNSYRIYVAKGNMLKRCDSYIGGIATISWTNLTNEVPDSFYITDLALDASDDRRLFIALGGFDQNNKVWMKDGINGNWINLTSNLPNVPVYSIVYHENSDDRIYVGTEIGVFYRDNTYTDWQYFGNYLPTVPVYDLQIEYSNIEPDRLYAATFGRGIWSTEITVGNCIQMHDLTTNSHPSDANVNGVEVFEAFSNIISKRIISGGTSTNVLYSAGDFVELRRGFEAKRNSIFTATLDGCTGTTFPE